MDVVPKSIKSSQVVNEFRASIFSSNCVEFLCKSSKTSIIVSSNNGCLQAKRILFFCSSSDKRVCSKSVNAGILFINFILQRPHFPIPVQSGRGGSAGLVKIICVDELLGN